MAEVVRPYRGVSAEQRRSERRDQLLEAALDVVGESGLGSATMRGVCARAGLTERYFYESFRSLDDALSTLYETLAHENDMAMLDAIRSSPPDLYERCAGALGAFVARLTDDPRKARFYVESMGSAALQDGHRRTLRRNASVLVEEMLELTGLDPGRHRVRLQLAALVIVGGIGDAVTEWIGGRLEVSRDELIAEGARLCVAAAGAA